LKTNPIKKGAGLNLPQQLPLSLSRGYEGFDPYKKIIINRSVAVSVLI
jgi:hypothetical protein